MNELQIQQMRKKALGPLPTYGVTAFWTKTKTPSHLTNVRGYFRKKMNRLTTEKDFNTTIYKPNFCLDLYQTIS